MIFELVQEPLSDYNLHGVFPFVDYVLAEQSTGYAT